ncbi:hypothetical protein K7X08_029751 [Anisodus acutangulus]|uniref:Transport inhibitor response 1 domain-containing protein n=1 Tax=Anisodus acutangulus TaxID=402998 RepID=A0A9Q1L395_9SOLA|nr:hypothetical protein K7X08_029751 [Anisodus acutangulus]
MIRRFPEVRSVNLKGKPHFADFNLVPEGWGAYVEPWIAAMSRSYPCLEEITLKRMVVSDESLELISTSFEHFKVLVLLSCEGFTTDGLAAIAANCRSDYCFLVLPPSPSQNICSFLFYTCTIKKSVLNFFLIKKSVTHQITKEFQIYFC